MKLVLRMGPLHGAGEVQMVSRRAAEGTKEHPLGEHRRLDFSSEEEWGVPGWQRTGDVLPQSPGT